MLKKRAIVYFLIMGFPIGLGAGAPSWLKLPQLAPAISTPRESFPSQESVRVQESIDNGPGTHFPDFGVIHPLVVGSFTLLFCYGVLLAADPGKKT
jgi:hypothetical protein